MSVSPVIRMFAIAILAFLGFFTATALAATAVAPPDGNWTDFLKPIYDSFVHGNYLAAGMMTLVLGVALLKRYAPDKWGISTFVHGDAGGTLLTLVASFGTAMVTSLAGTGTVSWAMFKAAGLIAVGAAGGYAIVKKLFIVPFLRPWAEKAPAWAKPILQMILWIFDKPTPIEKAEAAGEAAVKESLAKSGIEATTGVPKDVE